MKTTKVAAGLSNEPKVNLVKVYFVCIYAHVVRYIFIKILVRGTVIFLRLVQKKKRFEKLKRAQLVHFLIYIRARSILFIYKLSQVNVPVFYFAKVTHRA